VTFTWAVDKKASNGLLRSSGVLLIWAGTLGHVGTR
jgi:hypothetical protein